MDSGVPKGVIRAVLLLLLRFSFSAASVPSHEVDYAEDHPSPIYTYDRIPEVKHLCAPTLPVVLTELKPDDTRGERLKNELSFINGDWSQQTDAVPLISGKNDQMDRPRYRLARNVVSFWVMDVDSGSRSENMVSVSGILEIGFSRYQLFSDKPSKWSSDFETSSESTKIRITFEGVYAESDENNGERHVCLLGRSWMPDSDNVSLSHVLRAESSFGQDDQIMLLLRYPKTFTLTSRGIYGQMESLATKTDPKYFGKVSLSSQLNNHSSTYHFGSAQGLNTYNDSDIWFHGHSTIFGAMHFCYYLQIISWLSELKINLNHKSIVKDGLLGSFFLENEKPEDVKLAVRNLICNPGYQGVNTAKIAAEFVVWTGPSWLSPRETSGLSGKSIFAEGFWNSSERELRMLGCIGENNDKDSSICDYQVSLFVPTAFSIHRRSTVYGRITGIDGQSKSDATMILFENTVSTPFLFNFWTNFYASYEYSKLSLASAFKSKHAQVASALVTKLERTLLKYPSYNPNNHTSLSFLAGDLTVNSIVVPYTAAEFESCNVLTANLLFGAKQVHLSPLAANQTHLNIWTVALYGYLSITGQCFNDISLSVEGLYDPTVGMMHLIGCRDLRAIPVENTDSLEQGHDCLIEIEAEYPPMNVRWLLKQKLKISIRSQREKQDILHFSPIVIWTQPITYPQQMALEQFVNLYEIYLRFILLIVALYCVTYQLRYMSTAQGETSSSYISLVMLCIQVSSYIFPFYDTWSYMAAPSADGSIKVEPIDVSIIQGLFITICSELVTLARQVWTGRTKANPVSEVKVTVITCSIHVLGIVIYFTGSAAQRTLEQLKSYGGLAVDLFLLPQIILNRLWRIRSKPLRKIYYIGFSLIRALPHLYHYFQDPWSDSDYKLNFTFTYRNKLSDIVIAMTVILLAFVVYVQQRCCNSSPPEPVGETESLMEEKDVSNSN